MERETRETRESIETRQSEDINMDEESRESNILENIAFELFFCISRTINSLKECWNYLYDNYECFQETTDTISYLTTYTCNTIYQKRTEPLEIFWWSICRINRDTINKSESNTEYENKKSLEEIIIFEKPTFFKKDDFIIYHYVDFYLCFNNESEDGHVDLFQRWNKDISKKSNIRFLSIQYTHPELEEPVEVNLENEWYFIGNELLGKIHILRILEYQFSKSQYIFDERYILKIIDSDIHIFEITAEQYIRLGEETYEVIG
jgi:hypothetical protein